MTDKEIANFTRMADAFEEEIFKLRAEIETMKAKELETMERRMNDKVKIGELEKELSTTKVHLEMKDFIIDDLLKKIDEYEEQLGITHDVYGQFPAYCGTGKEQ